MWYLIEDKTTVTKMNVEIDLNRARGPGLPIRPPVSIDRPSLHTSKPGPPYPRRSLGLDVLPSRPLSSIDIFHIVNQFKTHKPVSPLGDSDPEECETKKSIANELPTIRNKGNESKTVLRSNIDLGSDLESRSQILKYDVKTIKTELVRPLSKNEWIIDTKTSRSICQVFRKKDKPTSKQDPEQTSEKENQYAEKCVDDKFHEQGVPTKSKEKLPSQVPVVKCSLNLLLIRRLPTSHETAVAKDVDQVIRDGERALFDKNTNESDDCAISRARGLKVDIVMNENDGEFSIQRKEGKRKRVNSNNFENETKRLYLPSQSISDSNSSVQCGQETEHEWLENNSPYDPGFPGSGPTFESGYDSLRAVGSDQDEYPNLQHPPRLFPSYYERMKMEAEAQPDERNRNDYLNEAKRLKNVADIEHNIMLQFISYIKAAMFFVLAGVSMDSDGKQSNKGSQNMYSEANTLIKNTYRKLRQQDSSSPHRETIDVLLILSMKAQAILQLKLYKSKRPEIKEDARTLNEYFAKKMVPIPGVEVPNDCVNVISPTLLQTGRVNSAGLPPSGAFLPESQNKDSKYSSQVVMVPVSIHSTLMKNHYNVGLLQASLDLWNQAHQMVLKTSSEDFFIRIKDKFGSLTLHSSLKELVLAVSDVLETLSDDYKDYSI